MLKKFYRYLALQHGRAVGQWKRTCSPSGLEWAAYVKAHGGLHSMGEHCSIQTNVHFADPKYTRLGNNVRLTGCTIFGHDGSVNMLNHAFGTRHDHVGKVDIKDDVFIGHGVIVMPGVTIGPRAIVAAGAVVSSDVGPDSVYAGVPARRICSIYELLERRSKENEAYPWRDLIEERAAEFDPALQPELDRLRVAHFFGDAG